MTDFRVIEARGRLGPLYRVEFQFGDRVRRTDGWATPEQAMTQAELQLLSLQQPRDPAMRDRVADLSTLKLGDLRHMAMEMGIREIRGRTKWELTQAIARTWKEQQNCG